MAGRTVGLASRTHAAKKEIATVVVLDDSIQATGTPKFSAAPKSCKIGKINVLLTVSPFVLGDYSEQLKILVICSIVCGVDSDEAAAKTPERVQLEGGLDAEHKVILL